MLATALVALVALAVAGCGDGKANGKPQRRAVQFPVEVQPVQARAVEYSIGAIGTIDVYERVQVTARVAGVVDSVKFDEGDVVKANQVLVAIDAARFALAERQARAAVDRAKIAIADAEAGLARRQTADTANPGLIPGEELETWKNKLAAVKADLAERTVARDRAALDQRDAYVRAPIAGEIESRQVVTGAYVQPGTVLATMVRRDPLRLRFDVAEADAAPLSKGATARFTVEGDEHAFQAKIVHVAAAADPTSRMVRVIAEIDDPERARLRAGGFAQVVVPIGGKATAPVIPESAVRPSERGFLAFVVEGEVAKERILELGMRTADGLVEVKRGLAVGDQLVVRGAEALRDGAPVRMATPPGQKPARPEKAAGPPAGKPPEKATP
ncbi:MAG: efflux RND transporter periplasmic adaptor subunit [Deltaproteobacteria bacterium]|nr:efflux RND transporter periplasmic adaptor subunit [Kofleriaceae bacterium]